MEKQHRCRADHALKLRDIEILARKGYEHNVIEF